MNGEFEFQFPWLLALLGLLPVYALLRGKTGKLSALTFSSADIAREAGAKARSAAGRFLFFLRLLAVALGIVAMAGPRLTNYHVETETPGIDIMLVLDLSWSMEAIDMGKPAEKLSRFAIASGVLKDFIAKRPNDRIGLIAFSGVPYLTSPLTLNHD
jgi:Ca-activated chloride channel family protein